MRGGASVVRPEGPLSVHVIRDRADKRVFIEMTRGLYADDPFFVQPLTFERLQHLDPAKNPALAHMEVGYWLVSLGTTPVGRVSAQINQAHLDHHGDATAQFGFLEAIDDPEIFRVLMDTVEIWARQRGMRRVQGPFTLSINDESGLLVDGFDSPPYLMMPHGRPYYAARLEELGYHKAKDLIAYEFDVQAVWPASGQRLARRVSKVEGLRVRSLDMRRYDEEIRLICDIFNDAWSENWGFIPFDEAEARHLAASIKPIVDADCFAIAELDGEAVAMAVTLPDVNDAIKDLDGRLFPFGWLKLLWRLKVRGVQRGRMPLMGVRKSLQGSLKGAAAAFGVIVTSREQFASRGYVHGELSWLLEDNLPVRQVVEKIGARPYKTYRIFERDIV